MTIKELRESKGLSQGKFAESIGIGRTAIVGYEAGKFQPKAEVIAKIKDVYGVDITAPVPAPAEGKKPVKKKAAPAPTSEEQPAPTKRGSRKKAAPTTEETKPAKRGKKKEETTPAVEEKSEGIGAAIKALRTGRGLSQKAFAESIGLKTNTVSAYEQGRIKPSEAVMAKIREVYGTLEAAAAATETTPAVEEKKPAPKKPTKRGKMAASEEAKPVEKKKTTKRGKKAEATPVVEEKKPAKRKAEAVQKKDGGVAVIIQSPMGGSITPEEILSKTGPVDAVYIRVDENKAYWVKGEETGSVDLW